MNLTAIFGDDAVIWKDWRAGEASTLPEWRRHWKIITIISVNGDQAALE